MKLLNLINKDNISINVKPEVKWTLNVIKSNFILSSYNGIGKRDDIKIIPFSKAMSTNGQIQLIINNKIIDELFINQKIASQLETPILFNAQQQIMKANLFVKNKKITLNNTNEFILEVFSSKQSNLIPFNVKYDENLLNIKIDKTKIYGSLKKTDKNFNTFLTIFNEDKTEVVELSYIKNNENNNFFSFGVKNTLQKIKQKTNVLSEITNLYIIFHKGETSMQNDIQFVNFKEKFTIDIINNNNDKQSEWNIAHYNDNVECFLTTNTLTIKLIKFNESINNKIILKNDANKELIINYDVQSGLIDNSIPIFTLSYNDNINVQNNNLSCVYNLQDMNNPTIIYINSYLNEETLDWYLYQYNKIIPYHIEMFTQKNGWEEVKHIYPNGSKNRKLYIGAPYYNGNIIKPNYASDGDLLLIADNIDNLLSNNQNYDSYVIFYQPYSNNTIYISIQHKPYINNINAQIMPQKIAENTDYFTYKASFIDDDINISQNEIMSGKVTGIRFTAHKLINNVFVPFSFNDIGKDNFNGFDYNISFEPYAQNYDFNVEVIETTNDIVYIKLSKKTLESPSVTYAFLGKLIVTLNNNNLVITKNIYYYDKNIFYTFTNLTLGYNADYKGYIYSNLPIIDINNDTQYNFIINEKTIQIFPQPNDTQDVKEFTVYLKQQKTNKVLPIQIKQLPKEKSNILKFYLNNCNSIQLSEEVEQYKFDLQTITKNNENCNQYLIYFITKKGEFLYVKEENGNSFNILKKDLLKNGKAYIEKVLIINKNDNSFQIEIKVI